MVAYEFHIRCPECKSVTTLVAHEAAPIIFECRGCGKDIVMQGTLLYTVSKDYVSKILKKHKVKPCGHVVKSTISEESKVSITDKKLKDLHNILSKYDSIDDIIQNM